MKRLFGVICWALGSYVVAFILSLFAIAFRNTPVKVTNWMDWS
jgi:hypothetical protein